MKIETRKNKLVKAINLALVCGALSSTSYSSSVLAFAEDEAEATEEKILVTGSRIRRDEFASASPIQILSTDDAKKQGISTIAEMLQRSTLVNGAQIDETINTNSGNSNATEAPPAGGVGSQNVGLRGLGAERTLILINGRRLGASGVRGAPSQPDLSLIPFDMVDRVEILSDSASAVYGADAVAGVINVILKESVEGVQFAADFSNPSDDGGDTKKFSFVTGGEGERSSFVFGGEVYERDRVSLGDRIDCVRRREINTSSGELYDYCYNAFPDNTAIILSTADTDSGQHGSVWNFYTPGVSNVLHDITGEPVPNWSGSANIPTPANYPSFLRNDITGNDRFRLNPAYNDNNDRLRSDLVQPVKRFSLMVNGQYRPEWGEENHIEINYDSSYFHRHLRNQAAIEQIYPEVSGFIPMENGEGGFLQNADGSLQMFENPLNPFGANALPVITLDDLSQDREVELDHFRFGTNITGDLPFAWAKENGWTFELGASYDRGDGVASQPLMNENHLSMVLNTLRYDSDGNLVCGIPHLVNPDTIGDILSEPDCVPVNFFSPSLFPVNGSGAGEFATQAERDFLLGERVNRTVTEQVLFSGFITGDLFSFDAGGTSTLVLGFERRNDTIDSQVDFLGQNGLIVGENPATEGFTRGSRSVEEFFGEISLPFLYGHDLAEELTLDLAFRSTDESNFGSESTERVRLLYAPNDWMSISTAYGTSFRAPNLREQFLGNQIGGEGGGSDPCNAAPFYDEGVYQPDQDTRTQMTLDNCVQSGVDPTLLGSLGTTTIPNPTGGSVDNIKPETAEQFTMTLKAAPVKSADYEFDFAITYFDILIEDTILAPGADFILDQCFNISPNLSNPFCARVGPRDPNRPVNARFPSFVDSSFLNIGEQTSIGWDINTRFGVNFDDVFGKPLKMVWSTQWTIQDELTTTIVESDNLPNNGTDDYLGTFGNPENRIVSTLAFEQGDFTLVLSGRYIDETEIFIRDPDNSGSTCLLSNSYDSTRIIGAPNVYRDCVAESKFYTDISLTWTPDNDFSTTFGIRNVADEDPAQVSSGLGNDRGGRMVATGYDQVGRSLFLNLRYKF